MLSFRHFHAMSVIPVTIFFSLLLAGLFVVLFAREQRQRRFASAERESLLPLADETPRVGVNESEGFPPN
jgi:cbb3-type cytochrome oxidase subunit 3